MRVFRDKSGAEWDVVVGRESWGMVMAIFVRRGGAEPPRQALLEATSAEVGNRALLGMSDEELQGLLGGAAPKPMT